MAARYGSEGDSTFKKNSFTASRSLSDSGEKDPASKGNFSRSFTLGGSGTEYLEFSVRNEQRAGVFDTICQHLGTLHSEPLSPDDWERFKEWCDHYDDSNPMSSEADKVYKKCRMLMIDVFGTLPTEKELMEGKDWYLARYQNSPRPKHDQREDTYDTGDTPMDTTELQHREQRQVEQLQLHEMDRHTRGDKSKSDTRREVDHLRQKQENTESELNRMKQKVHDLEEKVAKIQSEKMELSRHVQAPLIGITKEGAREEMEEERNRNDNRREQKIEELQMKCGQLTREVAYRDEELSKTTPSSRELTDRRGPLPLIGIPNEGAREDMEEERSRCDNRREQHLEESHMKCEQLQREITYRDEEIRELKSKNRKLTDRVNVLETECGQLHLDIKNQDQRIDRETSSKNILQRRLEDMSDQFNYHVNKAKQELSSKDYQIQYLEEEKADALRRLSTLASAKLSDNNPDITDLSDMNRPQKIGEKYSELYDNEWTDAYEYLTSDGQDHQKTVAVLLNVLESCFQYCKTVGRRQYEHLLVTACSPSSDRKDEDGGAVGDVQSVQTYKQTITQKVIELRKVAFQHSLKSIKQAYQTDRVGDIGQSTSQEISIYMDRCLEVSWLACIQDPPLEIVSDFSPYSRVDLNIVRKYTKSGEFVEYVIWPALLLSDNGALLSKGVVQCTSRSQDVGAQPPHQQQMRKPSKSNEDSEV